MLDMGAAWDDLVARMVPFVKSAERILSNRFYHYLSREMAGSSIGRKPVATSEDVFLEVRAVTPANFCHRHIEQNFANVGLIR